jgi:hypothetical protein
MHWILCLVVALLLYSALLCLHRLYFSPLTRIPGPRLAAMTGCHETYFELFHMFGGQYLFHIQELHREYGNLP